MKKIYLFFAAILFSVQGYSANITSTLSDQIICSSNYTTIAPIVVTEAGTGEFGTAAANTAGNFFFIVAPAGFEFDPGAGVNASFVGGNANGASVSFKTASVIAITYGCNNTVPLTADVLTISNIAVKALSINTSGSIYLGAGSFAIGGGPNGGSPGTTLAKVISAVNSISFAPTDQCDNDGNQTLLGTSARQAGVNNGVKTYSGPGVSGTTFDPVAAGGAGAYTLTYSFSTTSPTCAAFSTTATIVVKAAPTVTITSTESSGTANNDNTTCDTDPITFYANGATTYQFQRNGINGFGASTVTPYTRTSLANGDLVTVIGTTNGCSRTSAPITMTVNSLPPAVAFNPAITTYSSSDPAFVLDTLGTPAPFSADPWSLNSYFSGNGVVAGSGANAGKDLFYPDVAASFGNPVTLTYTYVDGNSCKKSITKDFTISGAVSTGSINGLNTSYCIDAAPATISIAHTRIMIDFSCFIYFGTYTFLQFEYYNPLSGGSWIVLPSVINGLNHDATFTPSVVAANGGVGLRQIRAKYTGGYCGGILYVTDYVTINPLPTMTITNKSNFGVSACQSFGDSLLQFSFGSGTTGITGFGSGSPNAGFIYFNTGDYYMKFSGASTSPGPTNTFSFNLQDAATTCTNTVPFTQTVEFTPATPIPIAVTDKCIGDNVTISSTVVINRYVDWARKDDAVKTEVLNIDNGASTTASYNVGIMAASDTFYIRQYSNKTCKSNWSPMIIVKVNTPPTVDAGVYADVCSNSSPVALSGVRNPGSLGITWTSATVGTFSAVPDINAPNPSYTRSFADSVAKKMKLYLTTDDPDGVGVGCNAAKDSAIIQIGLAPLVTAGLPVTWCSNTSPLLTATPSGSATSVTWTKSAGSGVIISPTSNSTNYTVAPGDYALGTPFPIIFTATTNDPDLGGPCLPSTSNVTITLNPHLTVSPGTDFAVCSNQPISFNGNVKIGGIDRTLGNSWKNTTGTNTVSNVQGPSNITGNYIPFGTPTTSGKVIAGTGEYITTTTVKAYLVSTDPDGAGASGPCKADSQAITITINPIPVPHFAAATANEYCLNTPPVELAGNLGSNFNPTGASATFTGRTGTGVYVALVGSVYQFDPSKTALIAPITTTINGSKDSIRYTYKDNNGCQNYEDTVVKVFPFPSVNFTRSTKCQLDTITFAETAAVSSAVFTSTETAWNWVIDGDAIQNITPFATLNTDSVKYAFANYGIHSIQLNVTSNSGGALSCYNKKDTTQIFGPYPVTDYSWSRPCSVDSVFYVNATTIASGYTNSIAWNMNDMNNTFYKNSTTSTSSNPNYKFVQSGIYNVSLTATTTTYDCVKIKTKEVYVIPTYSVTPTNPYDSSFALTTLDWAPSGFNDQPYSWQHGLPTAGKNVIKPGGGVPAWAGNKVWITDTSSTYKIGEVSYLNSPCFNFSTLDKPMLVMKNWASTTNLAGAVLEATTGTGNPWSTVGQIGNGLHWYNTSGIVGLIGSSLTNPTAEGFSGEDSTFRLSRIGLSQYANQSNLVRFRIAFGSSSVNDPLNKRDGIALDSIWIGNRSKVVLMEHFTNSLSTPCIAANARVNTLLTQRPGDVISIQYHTSFPGVDNMAIRNTADPSSKVLYYGIPTVPRTEVDGVQLYDQYGTAPTALNLNVIDIKALEDAKFGLEVSCKKTGLNLDIKALMVAKSKVTDNLVLNIAVLERSVSFANGGGNSPTGYQWVLTKMLPDAAGTFVSQSWNISDSLVIPQNWDFQLGDFYDTSQIEVVAFIQNYLTKEVYQAAKIGSNGSTSAVPIVTAVNATEEGNTLLIYPVPSDNEINILFSTDIEETSSYTFMNEMGVSVVAGKISKGVRMLTLNSADFASGVYYLSIVGQDGNRINKKVVVIH